MRKQTLLGLILVLLVPAAAIAQSNFNGTWRVDASKERESTKPYVYVLQNGMYHCSSCVPPESVKADGMDHKVAGDPYSDTLSVKVVNERTIEMTDKKDGKVVRNGTFTISPDGKTGAVEYTDSFGTAPVTGSATFKRVAAGPAGSHAISGSWVLTRVNQSDNGLTFTVKIDGDDMTMSSPTGQSYTAKLGGPDAPYKGDPGTTSVSVKRMGANTIVETDKRNGKPIGVGHMTVSADGKTMTIVSTDVPTGRVFHDVAVKQ
jgi:hypothetical protein